MDARIDALPALFDPWATPDGPPDSWLDWLAGSIGFELDENWTPTQRRQALARAPALLARRGTVQGLREMAALYAGVQVSIEEAQVHVWSLGETALLGFATQLAAAPAQGAVLGTTAVADRSHLLDAQDYGAPLYEASAHHFCVRAPAAALAVPGVRETLQRVLEQEKPAHTAFTLAPVAPQLVLGLQARVGEDAFVAGEQPALQLDDGESRLDTQRTLGASARQQRPLVGDGLRLGAGTRLA
jgi:phage tail-like protein